MYDTLQLAADAGLTMLVYTAEPGSSSTARRARRPRSRQAPQPFPEVRAYWFAVSSTWAVYTSEWL
jgi:hypothetical protein